MEKIKELLMWAVICSVGAVLIVCLPGVLIGTVIGCFLEGQMNNIKERIKVKG